MAAMSDELQKNPILKRFRAVLDEMYGDQLERAVPYGRRGRIFAGPARPDRRIASTCRPHVEEDGPFIHAMAYPAGFYNDPRMPLMYVIRAEGIDL
jgi:hypothetical protein